MAKAKPAEAVETINDRIAAFFKVQPYGQPASIADLNVDFPDDEVKKFVGKDEADAILTRMKTNGFALPDKADDKQTLARAKAVEQAVETLAKDGTLTRQKIEEPGKPAGMGFIFSGPRESDDPAIELVTMPLDQIKVDLKLQCRANGVDEKKAQAYAEVADRLPPMRVCELPDGKIILTRGFHRYKGFEIAGVAMVTVERFKGTRDDAKLDAIGDNAEHGIPRTMADVETAIGNFLTLPGKRNSSIAMIAKAAKCAWATADKLAKKVRKAKPETQPDADANGKPMVEGSDGKLYPATQPTPTETPAPESAPPAADAPAAPVDTTAEVDPKALSEVKDRQGNPVINELAAAFADDRLKVAFDNLSANVTYIRNFRTDGYSATSLAGKDRESVLADMERGIATLRLSLPYVPTPADAAEVDGKLLKDAAGRGWMTEAEHVTYNKRKAGETVDGPKKKGKGKPKADAAPAEAPPAATEAPAVEPAVAA